MHTFSRVGIGLRSAHYAEFFAAPPRMPLVELHAENHFAPGGPARAVAQAVAACLPLSLHGVGLSLGSADGVDRAHLDRLAALVKDTRPIRISEHLCWGRLGNLHSHELLPLPYNANALAHVSDQIKRTQDVLQQRLLIENVSAYALPAGSVWPEWEFLAALCARADCDLLLDVNNIYVNAHNFDFDPLHYLAAVPWDRVQEIHIAGHDKTPELLIDTHGSAPEEAVLCLLDRALQHCAEEVPVLLEWDTQLPAWTDLLAVAQSIDQRIQQHTNSGIQQDRHRRSENVRATA